MWEVQVQCQLTLAFGKQRIQDTIVLCLTCFALAMGSLNQGSSNKAGTNNSTAPVPGLWITGIGSACPPYCLRSETVEVFAKQFYDVEKPG